MLIYHCQSFSPHQQKIVAYHCHEHLTELKNGTVENLGTNSAFIYVPFMN